MATAINRNDVNDFHRQIDPANFPDPPYLINPDLTAVAGHPRRYWKIVGDDVLLMDAGEQAAVDAAMQTADTAEWRQLADDLPDEPDRIDVRALIELFNKRDNYLVNRIEQLQQTFDAIRGTTGGASTIRQVIPASFMATNTRVRSEAISDYRTIVGNGEADNN